MCNWGKENRNIFLSVSAINELQILGKACTKVQDAGCEAILVGESLVKQQDIAVAVKTLLA